MINPQQSAERIILNNPDLAKDVFDLLLWAASQADLKESDEYDGLLNLCWLRMQEGRDARESYAKERVESVQHGECAELELVESTAAKSH